MQTLNGMSRQGNYIGMTQRCKRFLENVSSAGAITERTVCRSGTGETGNGLLGRKLLCEVVHLFLGKCMPLIQNNWENHHYLSCQLKHGVISALEKELKAKFDRSQLDKETWINCKDDTASHLFNAVFHIYHCMNVAKRQEEEVVGSSLPNNMKDVLEEVMEHEPCEILPDIYNHI